MHVAVVGAGSIGSLLGGLLAREHLVTLVGREPHVTAVRESGLAVTGQVECAVHPEARTDTAGLDADLVLVTVKAHDVPAAADRLGRGVDAEVVVPLSNGLGHAVTLADRLPEATVLSGTTTYGAVLDGPTQRRSSPPSTRPTSRRRPSMTHLAGSGRNSPSTPASTPSPHWRESRTVTWRANPDGLHVVRDEPFYRWRLSQAPHAEYRTYLAEKDGTVVGGLVVSRWNSQSAVKIVDLLPLCPSGPQELDVVRELVAAAVRANSDTSGIRATPALPDELIHQFGFDQAQQMERLVSRAGIFDRFTESLGLAATGAARFGHEHTTD